MFSSSVVSLNLFLKNRLGFNCGEAANFGTPLWLSIAKEAAVRRAAMDHLPMLSHQQLLYLLTMSFISRSATFSIISASPAYDFLNSAIELSRSVWFEFYN